MFCHWTILDSATICIASIQMSSTPKSASYLDLHLEIDNGGRWKTTLRQTWWHHFTNNKLPFISSNIPASPTYEVYISQLIRYSRTCAQYSDCLDRDQLLTQKLLKQGYGVARLKLSLQTFYGRHHNLFDRYEISISQMTMDFLLFCRSFPFSVTGKTFTVLTVYMCNTRGVL